jgi:hypothetical protein
MFFTGSVLVEHTPASPDQSAAAGRRAALQESLGRPTAHPRASEPPPPPPVELTFSGVRTGGVFPLAFVPGRSGAQQFGRSPHELRDATGVSLSWAATRPGFAAEAIAAALAAARSKLAAIRDRFREHPLYTRWRELVAKLAAAERQTATVEQAPANALARARWLLTDGKDPAPAEAQHAESVRAVELHHNRLAALRDAVATAKRAAAAELARLLDAERAAVEAAAVAQANALADEIDTYVRDRLEALLVAHNVAGAAAADPRIATTWGGGPDNVTGPYRALPEPK